MNTLCIVMLFLCLMLGGISCSHPIEKLHIVTKITGQEKSLDEKVFDEEPKAPAGAIEEQGVLLGKEFESPPG